MYANIDQRATGHSAPIWACCLLMLCAGCDRPGSTSTNGSPASTQQTATTDLLFADVTSQTGLKFKHQAGGAPYFVPRSIGSGAALLDFDNDGRLDLYLIQNGGPDSTATNQLFHQQDDGTFRNVSANSGLNIAAFGMGVAVGDVNNDGKVDVTTTEFGGIRLFVNQTDGTNPSFRDATAESGLSNPAWGTSASFFDYDRDGWLDLIVVNYLDYDRSRDCTDAGGRPDFCGPQSFSPLVARLFHNLGNPGSGVRFHDVTIPSGLASKPGAGLGVLCADFDGDHWADIFVANDGGPNALWINQRDGTFLDEAEERGLAYNAVGETEADMGIGHGDVDGDGRLDLFVTHRANETHTLWSQISRGVFADDTTAAGILNTSWRGTGFGTTLSDFDNDGDLDLSLVNGRVLRAAGTLPTVPDDLDPFWHPYAQRDQILLNDGQGRFRDVSEQNSGFSSISTVSRGLACGDINNDGQLDLIVTSIDGPARLFQNVASHTGNWLLVKAVDAVLRRDIYGAEVHLQIGDRVWKRSINPGYSFLCSNDPRAHFGLGANEGFDNLRVVWPEGVTEDFGSGHCNQIITVARGQGTVRSEPTSAD